MAAKVVRSALSRDVRRALAPSPRGLEVWHRCQLSMPQATGQVLACRSQRPVQAPVRAFTHRSRPLRSSSQTEESTTKAHQEPETPAPEPPAGPSELEKCQKEIEGLKADLKGKDSEIARLKDHVDMLGAKVARRPSIFARLLMMIGLRRRQSTRDRLLYTAAEMENVRTIAKRDVENARQYAVSSFAKSLLDVADSLEYAIHHVPPEALDAQNKERYKTLLGLLEGVTLTDGQLKKALQKQGIVQFGKKGDKFDPNLHDAMFEYEDPTRTPGTLGQVLKTGYNINGRVLRAAQVGVVKKSSQAAPEAPPDSA